MTGRQPPRSPWPIAAAVMVALAAPAVAAPPRVTVQADRKDAQVGQPVLVTVHVRGAEEAPTVKPPAVEGARLTQLGEPKVTSTLAAGLEGKGFLGAGGGSHLANVLRGLGQVPNLGGLDPDLAKMIGDPNLLKGLQPGAGIPGVNTNDYVFTYQLTPQRAGPLRLAAFAIDSKGQTVTTPPLAVNVTEAEAQPWVRMALSLSNPTPLVGEQVQLYVDLLIQRGQVSYGGKAYPYLPVSKVALTLPPLDGSRQVELARPLEQFLRENVIEPGKHGFRVNDFPGEVKLEHEPADGQGADLDQARYRRRLAIPLEAREAGEVTIAAAQAAGEVYVPQGTKGRWEPFVVASEPLTFHVLDLRGRADRPADFTGAVGSLRVTAQASQTRMPAGTPFTLTVRLEGNGSVASAGAPDLGARPEFTKGFRVRGAEEARSAADNAREFTYTLRPLAETVSAVPAVTVSYLDPKTNTFRTAQSDPIPLQVSAAQNATPDVPPVPAAAGPAAAGPAAGGLPAAGQAAPAAAAPPAPPATGAEPTTCTFAESFLPWGEGAMALGVLACAAVWGVRRLRGRRPVEARPVAEAPRVADVPRAPAVARPRAVPVAPAMTFAGVRQTLQDFLRRRFRLPPGEVTPRDAEDCLRRGGVSAGLARSFAALLDTCETAEFAPGMVSASPPDLADYARQLIEQIVARIPEVVA